MNANEYRTFQPCARRQHAECLGAKFENLSDKMGSYQARIVCDCYCHNQGEIWPALHAPERKQAELFTQEAGELFGRKAS